MPFTHLHSNTFYDIRRVSFQQTTKEHYKEIKIPNKPVVRNFTFNQLSKNVLRLRNTHFRSLSNGTSILTSSAV